MRKWTREPSGEALYYLHESNAPSADFVGFVTWAEPWPGTYWAFADDGTGKCLRVPGTFKTVKAAKAAVESARSALGG